MLPERVYPAARQQGRHMERNVQLLKLVSLLYDKLSQRAKYVFYLNAENPIVLLLTSYILCTVCIMCWPHNHHFACDQCNYVIGLNYTCAVICPYLAPSKNAHL